MIIYYCIYKDCIYNTGEYKCTKNDADPENNIVLNEDECKDLQLQRSLFEVRL